MSMKCLALAILAATVSCMAMAAGPSTSNPGLHYYYDVPKAQPPQDVKVDVCVYGGTVAGVSAAVQAGRMGKTVALAVFRRHVGGMTSGGLTAVDIGKKDAIGGMTRDFFRGLAKPGTYADWSVELGFRPSEAENRLLAMLKDAGVKVYFEHRLQSVEKDGAHLRAITFENGNRIEARMFVDASYEGDLLARSGVSYVVGREDNQGYGETVNGFQISFTHQFRFPVDPYRVPGDPKSGLLPGISSEPPGKPGTADKRVQAYNFRLWLVKAAEGQPFPKPADYRGDEYALLLRYLTTRPGFPWDFSYQYGPIKLNLADCNNAGPFSTDFVGGSYDWPDGDYATRERLFQAHVTYQQGLFWFLAHDEAVPSQIRARMQKFALPKDEFPETGGWPHELYVREARRMVSDYVMTQHNFDWDVSASDSVGLGSYTIDSHHTARVVVDGRVLAEGDTEHPSFTRAGSSQEGKVVAEEDLAHLRGKFRPYPISYRAIVPRQGQCDNLLVPVCLSSTHAAFGSLRVEPVFMILGQSAGTAAALAIDAGVPVQRLDYAKLRQRLLADGQLLTWSETPSKPAEASKRK
jgi:hypothetical protein